MVGLRISCVHSSLAFPGVAAGLDGFAFSDASSLPRFLLLLALLVL